MTSGENTGAVPSLKANFFGFTVVVSAIPRASSCGEPWPHNDNPEKPEAEEKGGLNSSIADIFINTKHNTGRP
jgi:hypothetical protein